MKEKPYINDRETKEEFRRKARTSIIIAICVLTVITAVTEYLGKYTDLIYNTDIFKVKSLPAITIKTDDGEFKGDFFDVKTEKFGVEGNNISADILISKYTNSQELSPKDFILAEYDISGHEVEMVFFPETFEFDSENILHLTYKDSVGFIAPEETVYCLRIDTHSNDGILNILCHINK